MLRRIITEVFEEVTGGPRLPMSPLPRPRGEALRDVGERRRRLPEPEATPRDEERRARPAAAPASASEPEPDVDVDLVGALGSPAEVRRAFVLMEVLGPPVSLRER
jgi:hypothetical protein